MRKDQKSRPWRQLLPYLPVELIQKRAPYLCSLMSPCILRWCGSYHASPLWAGSIEWSNTRKRSLHRINSLVYHYSPTQCSKLLTFLPTKQIWYRLGRIRLSTLNWRETLLKDSIACLGISSLLHRDLPTKKVIQFIREWWVWRMHQRKWVRAILLRELRLALLMTLKWSGLKSKKLRPILLVK